MLSSYGHILYSTDALVSERVVNLREFRQYVKQSRRDNCSYFRKEFAVSRVCVCV